MKAFPASVIVDGAFLREGYFDFVSIPVYDDDLNVVAIYNSVVNRTRDTLEARRSETLASISAVVDHTIELENTWERIRSQLSGNVDLPQALIFSLSLGENDETKLVCKLESSIACKRSIILDQFLLHEPSNNLAAILRYSLTTKNPLYLSARTACGRGDL